jgi:hypothetical protein
LAPHSSGEIFAGHRKIRTIRALDPTMRRLPTYLLITALGLIGLLPVAGSSALLGSTAPTGTWHLDGNACDLIEVDTAAPAGVGTCPGVRPGGVVVSDTGQCTMNFLFEGGDGRRYIGTAGHCILGDSPIGGDVGEQSWAVGTGPEARDGDGTRIGEFAYAILQDPKDFALIRLDAGVDSNPQMCHFGGPTGTNSDNPGLDSPTVLQLFGNGVGIGTVLPARSMVAFGMPDPDHVFAQGVVLPGDSGSGVISADGRAVGVAVTTGLHSSSIGTSGIDAGEVGITRLAPQVTQAQSVLGISLTLLTAPTL